MSKARLSVAAALAAIAAVNAAEITVEQAGIAAEANGEPEKALSFYKTIKTKWGNAPEAMEIDKYITRIETAE